MADSFLEPGERAFLEALEDLEIPFMIVGLGAAVMQGAPVATQDLDLWLDPGCEEKNRETKAGA